jgi:hypothetical protein
MVTRRGFLVGMAAAGAAMSGVAHASVARAVGLNELVHKSRHAIVGTPIDASCKWETIGKRRRIVTYSLVRLEDSIDGRVPSTNEMLVRTLGGAIGDLGQIVHGEAMLALDEPAAVFLSDIVEGVFRVTAMSQGHYPILVESAGPKRLHAGVQSLELVGPPDGAVHRLDGRTLVEARSLVLEELARGIR